MEEALRAEVVVYAIGIGDPSENGVDRKALEKLCEPTGGRVFVPKDVEGLDQAFEQLERELRQQYLVAYEPANMTDDGKFRKIEVRIANRKDIRVRHRRGYYGPGHSQRKPNYAAPEDFAKTSHCPVVEKTENPRRGSNEIIKINSSLVAVPVSGADTADNLSARQGYYAPNA